MERIKMNTAVDTRQPGFRAVSEAECTLAGADQAGGRYLRQFWQPVYHTADLKAGAAVPLKIMNDDFTLYRAESGGVHLTEARCPHRGTQLSTGWVEGEAIRCFYHGWKFGADGKCLEQPAEENSFCGRVSVRTWPVREYLGLVFAFLGQGPAPEFPRYPEFENFDGLLEIDSYSRNCNFFQNLENALDMAHVGFVHGDNRASFQGIGLGRSLKALESDWGITYTFTRADGRERIQQFGMPNIFYMTALPNEEDVEWQESLFWWVPVTDLIHMQFSLHRVPLRGEAVVRFKARREVRRSQIDVSHQELCEDILAGRATMRDALKQRVDVVRLQDDVAQIGQGRMANRDHEKLGRADIGVAVTRKLWRREVNALVQGAPLKHWQRDAKLVPKVWQLHAGQSDAALAQMTKTAVPEIIDIRPHIEVKEQLGVLHRIES